MTTFASEVRTISRSQTQTSVIVIAQRKSSIWKRWNYIITIIEILFCLIVLTQTLHFTMVALIGRTDATIFLGNTIFLPTIYCIGAIANLTKLDQYIWKLVFVTVCHIICCWISLTYAMQFVNAVVFGEVTAIPPAILKNSGAMAVWGMLCSTYMCTSLISLFYGVHQYTA